MTRRDLMRLFVRLFGLLILVNVVLQLTWPISMLVLDPWDAALFYSVQADVFRIVVSSIGSLVPYAIVGICFLWWSGRVVGRARLASGEGEAVESIDLRSMEIILVAVLGLYLLADGFAVLCRSVIQGLIDLFRGRQLSEVWGIQISFIIQASIKLTLGILFVLSRGGIAAVLHRVHAWVRRWRAWPDEVPLSER